MNNIKIFNSPDFGQIRTIQQNGEPWFVGKDVADILGYSNSSKAIPQHVDEEDRQKQNLPTAQNGKLVAASWLINESGLYSLILSSKMPKAKEFKRWVTSEVIPAIRKTGGYIAGSENMTDAEIMAKAVLVAQSTIRQRDQRIKELESDVAAAKPKRLFQWLRDNGYLIKRQGADYNSPTQRSMELGLFRVKETPIIHADGHVTVNKTVKVTPKAQIYFANKFLGGKCSEGFE